MRLRDERGDVRDLCLSRLHGKMREEFDIALRALDRRKRQVPDGKMQGIGQREEALQHIRVDGRVAHDALLPDALDTAQAVLDAQDWQTGEDVMHWWMEDGVLPGHMVLEGMEDTP